MTVEVYNLRVSKILSNRYGGYIFTAALIDQATGAVSDSTAYAVVKASAKVIGGRSVQIGMWVEVAGAATKENRLHDGYSRQQISISADSITMVRPSGDHLIRFLADSAGFKGVGTARARQLWNVFGESLYGILDRGDKEQLSTALPEAVAADLIVAWAEIGNSEIIRWLHECDFKLGLARKVVRHFGSETKRKLEEDPYRLLSFCASWQETDAFARMTIGVALDDPRRLLAACEEALYRSFSEGDTAQSDKTIRAYIKRLLVGIQKPELDALIEVSLMHGQSNGGYIVTQEGLFQSLGAAVMERTIARAFAHRLAQPNAALLSAGRVASLLAAFEATEGVSLTPEQKVAVEVVAERHLVCISGGAGVGKTTVLKAILTIVSAAVVPVRLIALAGRAAKRISEATGHPAQTIAGFIKNVNADDLINGILIVDEASMVDVISMERIVSLLPSSCRIVLVGDSSQLMPVGPGLVFHTLVGDGRIPNIELKSAKRFGHEIARMANAMRGGEWLDLGADIDQPTAFLDALDATELADTIIDLYDGADSETQVLCATRSGPAGSMRLNEAIQSRYNPSGQPLIVFDERNQQQVYTGFRLNDIVLCTRNIYELDLRNGSLGRIDEIAEEQTSQLNEHGEQIGIVMAWVVWDDGVRRPVFEDMLDDLELGYAITVHKAQGSQWKRILIPIVRTRNLDRSLLYTAVTRAEKQVIMVGQTAVAAAAICGLPNSRGRVIGLHHAIQRELHAC